jgi:hypothetical protein
MRGARTYWHVVGVSLLVVSVWGCSSSPSKNTTASVVQPVEATPTTRVYPPISPSFWTDYVQVDAADGTTLRVHSTRNPDVVRPYEIVTDEHTMLDLRRGVDWRAAGLGPGTKFYFTGDIESGATPTPRTVRALRIVLDHPVDTP